MISQRNAVVVLCFLVILMQQIHLGKSRPQNTSKASKQEAERRQDVELTKETQIGDAKVGVMKHYWGELLRLIHLPMVQ